MECQLHEVSLEHCARKGFHVVVLFGVRLFFCGEHARHAIMGRFDPKTVRVDHGEG